MWSDYCERKTASRSWGLGKRDERAPGALAPAPDYLSSEATPLATAKCEEGGSDRERTRDGRRSLFHHQAVLVVIPPPSSSSSSSSTSFS